MTCVDASTSCPPLVSSPICFDTDCVLCVQLKARGLTKAPGCTGAEGDEGDGEYMLLRHTMSMQTELMNAVFMQTGSLWTVTVY
jgi:hypothetical protein